LVDIPKDVSIAKAEFKYPDRINLRGYNPAVVGSKQNIRLAAEEIMKAKKPIIYVGGGAVFSDAAEEIRELAEITQIPVTMTLMGLRSAILGRSASSASWRLRTAWRPHADLHIAGRSSTTGCR
jgi:thiamine pyrophosphate-dependent acetolactate synthase large subunit-like protein